MAVPIRTTAIRRICTIGYIGQSGRICKDACLMECRVKRIDRTIADAIIRNIYNRVISWVGTEAITIQPG